MKILELENKSKVDMLNFLSTDATRIENGILFTNSFLFLPLQLVCVVLILVKEAKLEILFGLVLLPLLVPIQYVLGNLISKYK